MTHLIEKDGLKLTITCGEDIQKMHALDDMVFQDEWEILAKQEKCAKCNNKEILKELEPHGC